jgi:hypothetical protein
MYQSEVTRLAESKVFGMRLAQGVREFGEQTLSDSAPGECISV